MLRILIIYLVSVLLVSCLKPKWPTDAFVKENDYQEVIGKVEPGKEKPDKYALYPNGQQGINNLIAKNIRYPSEAVLNKITGTVIISYIVEKDGLIKEIEVIQKVHPLLENEAIRIIKLMDRWIPGKVNGKPVSVQYRQPFNFQLNK